MHRGRGGKSRLTWVWPAVQTKNLMQQLLTGMAFLHENWVLHRDLKTSNILYNNQGQLKICDFGMARQYGSPLRSYSSNVVTQYYRSIELLLGGLPLALSSSSVQQSPPSNTSSPLFASAAQPLLGSTWGSGEGGGRGRVDKTPPNLYALECSRV